MAEPCVSFAFLKRALWLLCGINWKKKVGTRGVVDAKGCVRGG